METKRLPGKTHFSMIGKWFEENVASMMRPLEKTGHPADPYVLICTTNASRGEAEAALAYFMYDRARKLGFPVVYPTDELFETMADHVDVTDAIKETLPQMPEQTFWFALPESTRIYMNDVSLNGTDRLIRATGAYVSTYYSSPNNRVFSPDKGGEDWVANLVIWLWAPSPNGSMTDDCYSHVVIHAGADVDKHFSVDFFRPEVVIDSSGAQVHTGRMLQGETSKDGLLRTLRAVIGVLLYMQTTNVETELSTPEQRQAEFQRVYGRKKNQTKGAVGLTQRRMDMFGHSRILYVGMGKKDRTYGLTGEQRDSSSSRVKHWVRGHFRLQPVGPGRTGRKAIFIAPHQRGDADSPVSGTTYRVQ